MNVKIGQRWLRLSGYNYVMEIVGDIEQYISTYDPNEMFKICADGKWLTNNGKSCIDGEISEKTGLPASKSKNYDWKLLVGQETPEEI